jgi:hypothetical protein
VQRGITCRVGYHAVQDTEACEILWRERGMRRVACMLDCGTLQDGTRLGADLGRGEPGPGAGVARLGPVATPMWAGVSPGLGADVGRVPAPMCAGVGPSSRGADVGGAGRTIDCQHRRQEPLDHEQRTRGSEGRRCAACNV